jgi:Rrf2 family nitric oxide-sensitive transcriptional repressor
MMRLTAYSDYALRLLMYLAVRPERLSTIPEVATAYGISTNHLMKVAHQLGQAGYIETVRGRGGGLRLKQSASQIGLGAVVRHTEPDMDIVPCFRADNQDCPLRRVCSLRMALLRAQQAFLKVLDDYTIGDLVVAPEPLRSLLALEAAPTQMGV